MSYTAQEFMVRLLFLTISLICCCQDIELCVQVPNSGWSWEMVRLEMVRREMVRLVVRPLRGRGFCIGFGLETCNPSGIGWRESRDGDSPSYPFTIVTLP